MKSHLCTLLASLFLTLSAAAQPAGEIFQLRVSEILLADGSRIEGGVLLIENGKIRKVGRGVEVDDNLPLIEYDGLVTAGMIACQTESGAGDEAFDPTRSVLPEASMAYAFDPDHSDFERALEAGVTSMVLAPRARNVVGGTTAVVKSHGGTVVKRDAHLALSFSKFALSGAAFSDDDDLEDTARSARGMRAPTSYSGAVRALQDRFEAPEGAFAEAAEGRLPVLIDAWDRNEVARALDFAGRFGLRGALRGAPRAGEMATAVAESGLGVVLGPFRLGHDGQALDAVPALVEASVPLAFAMDAPRFDPAQMRLSAALVVAAGVDPAVAWRALTADAARIAGVDDRLGRLERGMDADLVVWTDHPLNLTSRVLAVFVDGRRVYQRESR